MSMLLKIEWNSTLNANRKCLLQWVYIVFSYSCTCYLFLVRQLRYTPHPSYVLCLFMQQYSKQLEETMEKFAQGAIKILICTNIVESGLDIQNANTIIVQDVQQFGLAQLYQVLHFAVFSYLLFIPKFLTFLFGGARLEISVLDMHMEERICSLFSEKLIQKS